jgi:hypothetical protein
VARHNQVIDSAELYDPNTGTFRETGSMSVPRLASTATLLPNGRVLIVGGNDWTGGLTTYHSSAEIYDPATGRFSPTGSMWSVRYSHTAAMLSDGRVLVVGGYDGLPPNMPTPRPSAEIYQS